MSEDNDQNNEESTLEIEKDTIKKIQEENSDLKEKWQRALADYQNLERRVQIEIAQRVSNKTNDLLLSFINIYEDFILSLIHI